MFRRKFNTHQVPPCPNGFLYTIRAGDTFWGIGQRLGIPVTRIRRANPRVDPERLRIGQQICIPIIIPPFPLCEVLRPVEADLPDIALGVALINEGERSVDIFPTTFAATGLPEPSELGEFTSYIASVSIPQPPPDPPVVHSVRLVRTAVAGQQVTWAGTRILPDRPFVGSDLVIRPIRFVEEAADVLGPVVLRGVVTADN